MYEYSNVYVNKMYMNVTRPTTGEYFRTGERKRVKGDADGVPGKRKADLGNLPR
jgi:hypothetical protein